MTWPAIAQVLIAASVLFVWIVRLENVEREFVEYGIPPLLRNAVGAAKISLATLLLAGLRYPDLTFISAMLMALLMLCALIAHWRVRHAWRRSVPALLLMLLSLGVARSAYIGLRR
jgi:DoxX-like family